MLLHIIYFLVGSDRCAPSDGLQLQKVLAVYLFHDCNLYDMFVLCMYHNSVATLGLCTM
jgi:hypothetical protein